MTTTLEQIIIILMIATGVTYVLSGSKIGHPIRFAWCWALDRLHISYFWSIMICPPCNAWWTGLAISWLNGLSMLECVALAFANCGVVATIQAVGLSIGLQSEEDYSELIPQRGKGKRDA